MSGYMYCATDRGIKEHIADGEDCRVCKDWMNRGKPVVSLEPPVPRRRRVTVVADREHGSMTGYRQHKKYGEPVCDPCADAVNEENREYRARKKAEANQ